MSGLSSVEPTTMATTRGTLAPAFCPQEAAPPAMGIASTSISPTTSPSASAGSGQALRPSATTGSTSKGSRALAPMPSSSRTGRDTTPRRSATRTPRPALNSITANNTIDTVRTPPCSGSGSVSPRSISPGAGNTPASR